MICPYCRRKTRDATAWSTRSDHKCDSCQRYIPVRFTKGDVRFWWFVGLPLTVLTFAALWSVALPVLAVIAAVLLVAVVAMIGFGVLVILFAVAISVAIVGVAFAINPLLGVVIFLLMLWNWAKALCPPFRRALERRADEQAERDMREVLARERWANTRAILEGRWPYNRPRH